MMTDPSWPNPGFDPNGRAATAAKDAKDWSLPSFGSHLNPTLARTDLLYMLNWGTQWTMVSYLEKWIKIKM